MSAVECDFWYKQVVVNIKYSMNNESTDIDQKNFRKAIRERGEEDVYYKFYLASPLRFECSSRVETAALLGMLALSRDILYTNR